MTIRSFLSGVLVLVVACPAVAWVRFLPGGTRETVRLLPGAGRSIEDEVEGVDEVDTAPPPPKPTPPPAPAAAPAPAVTPAPTPAELKRARAAEMRRAREEKRRRRQERPATPVTPAPPPAIEPAPQPVVTPAPLAEPEEATLPRRTRRSRYRNYLSFNKIQEELWLPWPADYDVRLYDTELYTMCLYFNKLDASKGPMDLQSLLQNVGYFEFGTGSLVWNPWDDSWLMARQEGTAYTGTLSFGLGRNAKFTFSVLEVQYDERDDWPVPMGVQLSYFDRFTTELNCFYSGRKAAVILDGRWTQEEEEWEYESGDWPIFRDFWADAGLRLVLFKEWLGLGLGYQHHWKPGESNWGGRGDTATFDLYLGTKVSFGWGTRSIHGADDDLETVRVSLNISHVLGFGWSHEYQGDWEKDTWNVFLRW